MNHSRPGTKLLASAVAVIAFFSSAHFSHAQIFFTTPAGFNTAAGALTLMGSENWSSAGNAVSTLLNDPLLPGVAQTPFPTGTNAASGIAVQSNNLANPLTTSPRGANGLFFAPTGFAGTSGNLQASNQLSANNLGDSFDIIFSSTGGLIPQAVDLSPMYYQISGGVSGNLTIRVFNTANTLLGTTTVSNVADVSEAGYIGIVLPTNETLGRVNISAGSLDVSGADNIRVFGAGIAVPEPTTWALIGIATVGTGAYGWKKRRKNFKNRFAKAK